MTLRNIHLGQFAIIQTMDVSLIVMLSCLVFDVALLLALGRSREVGLSIRPLQSILQNHTALLPVGDHRTLDTRIVNWHIIQRWHDMWTLRIVEYVHLLIRLHQVVLLECNGGVTLLFALWAVTSVVAQTIRAMNTLREVAILILVILDETLLVFALRVELVEAEVSVALR